MRTIYRLLGFWGDAKTLRRSPGAYGRRQVRRRANRAGNRWLRRALKP